MRLRTMGIFLTGTGVGMLVVLFFWRGAPQWLWFVLCILVAGGGVFWTVGRDPQYIYKDPPEEE